MPSKILFSYRTIDNIVVIIPLKSNGQWHRQILQCYVHRQASERVNERSLSRLLISLRIRIYYQRCLPKIYARIDITKIIPDIAFSLF